MQELRKFVRANRKTFTEDEYSLIKILIKAPKGKRIRRVDLAYDLFGGRVGASNEYTKFGKARKDEVCEIIHQLRLKYEMPIFSDAKGYFIPRDLVEAEKCFNMLKSRAISQFKSLKQIRNGAKFYLDLQSDQMKINFKELI